ncbi:hypothetical protein WOLCODRAFT_71312 [Wolfiporia cocos MD-104 SS10]|uniref:HD/PDEase domain-containing protein n=1 Tax=Wolfiporia cocos (strain MD-104) TaxID=742152 RepID=A0A2H3JHQ8_WOLCO|nr:hypothetical protein WOLCODRAFT_71312 [Wolfiporia cocos MD-104 SS10]
MQPHASPSAAVDVQSEAEQRMQMEESLKRSVTIVFWYKPKCAPIRLHMELSTFPLFQLSQCTQLVTDLGMSPSAFVDVYNPYASAWEQQAMSAVRVVESEQRLLFRARKNLLEGLSDTDCPGIHEEVKLQRRLQGRQSSAASKLSKKRAVPDDVVVEESLHKQIRTEGVPAEVQYLDPQLPRGPPTPTSRNSSIGIPEPSISTDIFPTMASAPHSRFVNMLPPPEPPTVAMSAFQSTPTARRWPNDYPVCELADGFRQMDALIAAQPGTTQRVAFERVFACRYVKSTVCRHRGVWRRARADVRERFESMGVDPCAVWTEFIKHVEGGTGRTDVSGRGRPRSRPMLGGEMMVVMVPEMQMLQQGEDGNEPVERAVPVMGSLGPPPPDLDEGKLCCIGGLGNSCETAQSIVDMRLMESDDDVVGQQVASAMASLDEKRYIKDWVYDYVSFTRELFEIIDTPQFQRLRKIKQLGTSYYIWPGASHNRFEHCLGVGYLAQEMATHLQKTQPELGITRRDIKCVTIAGLCHDLGHGPWSHVWDGIFIPRALPGSKWCHEDASEMMFDDLVEDNEIEISEEDVSFIKALIAGDPKRCLRKDEKPFLFEIVANKRNGLDVDKLIFSARAIGNQICYNFKDASQIYELFHTRFSLHKRIYNHKSAKAIEHMIVDALLVAEPHLKFANDIRNPKKYLHLTDDLRGRIEASDSPELAEARAIFHRVNKRDLYKCVDYKVFSYTQYDYLGTHFTPERIVQAAQADGLDDVDPQLAEELDAKHVIVDLSRLHYGMREKNPLDSVSFYSKHNRNFCGLANREDLTLLLPSEFEEVLLRIYTRDSRFFGRIQAGYNALLREMQSKTVSHQPNLMLDLMPPLDDDEFLSDSPPQPRPRDKRPFSRVQSADARLSSAVTHLSPNSFTAVPRNYPGRLASPTKDSKKERVQKRGPDEAGLGTTPTKKAKLT